MRAAVQVLIAIARMDACVHAVASRRSYVARTSLLTAEGGTPKTASAKALSALTVRAGFFNALGEASLSPPLLFTGASWSQLRPGMRPPLWVNVMEQARHVWRV